MSNSSSHGSTASSAGHNPYHHANGSGHGHHHHHHPSPYAPTKPHRGQKNGSLLRSKRVAGYLALVVGCAFIAAAVMTLSTAARWLASYKEQMGIDLRDEIRRRELAPYEERIQVTKAELTRIERDRETLHGKVVKLEREIHAQRQRTDTELEEFANGKLEMANTMEKLEAYKSRMHLAIQRLSRAQLLDKYGPGPHYVEMALKFDPEDKSVQGRAGRPDSETHENPQEDTILIEMASVDQMPHTVYWFLEQVDRGLYDGCSFYRNARHVVQGGPVAPNWLNGASGGKTGSSDETSRLTRRFLDSGIDSVLFQEYSEEFPHHPNTVGFAGRPFGGPNFYINVVDNSENHGPGGQQLVGQHHVHHHDDVDPCFARVVDGFGAVEKLKSVQTEDDGTNDMVHHVAITSMRILYRRGKDEDKQQEPQQPDPQQRRPLPEQKPEPKQEPKPEERQPTQQQERPQEEPEQPKPQQEHQRQEEDQREEKRDEDGKQGRSRRQPKTQQGPPKQKQQ